MHVRYLLIVFVVLIGACSSDHADLRAALNQPERLRALLDAGADPNAREDGTEQTILHTAVAQRERAAVELLLERGADPTLWNHIRRTPLDETILQDSPELYSLLLHKHPDLAAGREDLLLISAAELDRAQMLEYFRKNGTLAHHPQVLFRVCRVDSSAARTTILYLLDHIPASSPTDDAGQTPLFIGRCRSDTAILARAVARGWTLAHRDARHELILHHAARAGDLESVRWLVEHASPLDSYLVVEATSERTVPDNRREREYLAGGRSVERVIPGEKTLRSVSEVPLLEYARDHDAELYQMLRARGLRQ